MNKISFYGLTCLLLPSVTPAFGAAAYARSKMMTAGRRRPAYSPVKLRSDVTRTKYDESLEKYEESSTPADVWTRSNVLTPHEENNVASSVQNDENDEGRFKRQPIPTTTAQSTTTEETTTTKKVPAPPQDAVVETRPDLIHPAFTTYFFSVTLPCVIAWVLVTWLCLWICRPHSPLYREILKRLIEHSQMKQKSVLFAATVLAGERKPPEDPATETPASPSKA